jgi:hypothetical protein
MALTNWIKSRREEANSETRASHAQKDPRHEPPPLNPLAPRRARGNTSASSSGRSSGSVRFNPIQLNSANTPGFHSGTSTPESDSQRGSKAELLASWLYGQQLERVWNAGAPGEGVFAKISKGHYACEPKQIPNDGTYLYQAIAEMNVKVSLGLQTLQVMVDINDNSVP